MPFDYLNDSLHDNHYNNLVNADYYTHYKNYLVGRSCCEKSNLYSKKLDNYNDLVNANYHRDYKDYLIDNLCKNIENVKSEFKVSTTKAPFSPVTTKLRSFSGLNQLTNKLTTTWFWSFPLIETRSSCSLPER